MSSDAFPLDFAALEKGSEVPREKIEEIYQVRQAADPERFRLSQLKLVELIEQKRRDLYPRTRGDAIRIMTDREAEQYNGERHRAHVAGMVRDARRRGRIDRSEFTDAERRAAESRDLSFSAMALMSRRALQKAEREAKMLAARPEESGEGE